MSYAYLVPLPLGFRINNGYFSLYIERYPAATHLLPISFNLTTLIYINIYTAEEAGRGKYLTLTLSRFQMKSPLHWNFLPLL
jgi:hypothetical protein